MKNNEKIAFQAASNGGLTSETVEAVMLSGGDEMLEAKIIAELEQEKALLEAEKNRPQKIVENFADVPENLVFTDNTTFKLFNRDNKLEFFISGKEVERRIGQDEILYNKVKNRTLKAFCVDNSVITFLNARY